MLIRLYEDADERAVIALWRQVLPDSAAHNDPATAIRKKLEVERDLFLVATLGDTVAGTIMGAYDGHRGWLYAVAVKPEHERQGIGSALVRRMEQALEQRGCLKINLQVRSSNARVIGFYEKLGYKVDPVISMGKRLYE